MFERPFSHYLLYGATDQETLRRVKHCFDGVIVPGTLAAFQKQGTGGFVLTLSATSNETPFIIDPRFPLFQQRLSSGKKSHADLAEVFRDEALVSVDRNPTPHDFTPERIERIAAAWVEFNEGFADSANEKFDKYAARLEQIGESLAVDRGQDVEAIIPPYFVETGGGAWAQISDDFEQAVRGHTDKQVIPVLAADTPALLAQRLDGRISECFIWVSDLKELDPLLNQELTLYGRTIRSAATTGSRLFALYGGFFSVLLSSAGLQGSCHGVGFSESRAWVELPQSGPPMPRFYLPAAHRFVAPDVAQRIYNLDRELGSCSCEICDGRAPLALNYHDLMKHSVAVRALEIERWGHLSPADAVTAWSAHVASLIGRASRIRDDLEGLGRSAARTFDHLAGWRQALTDVHA